MNERGPRFEKFFEVPMLVAELLVVLVIAVEPSSRSDSPVAAERGLRGARGAAPAEPL